MATTQVLKVIATLDNGKTSTITLPQAVNDDISDPDSGDSYITAAMPAIAAAFATDDGATIASATFKRVVTEEVTVAEDISA